MLKVNNIASSTQSIMRVCRVNICHDIAPLGSGYQDADADPRKDHSNNSSALSSVQVSGNTLTVTRDSFASTDVTNLIASVAAPLGIAGQPTWRARHFEDDLHVSGFFTSMRSDEARGFPSACRALGQRRSHNHDLHRGG